MIDEFEKLPLKAKELILNNIDKIDTMLLDLILTDVQYCNSPIEIILSIALNIITEGKLYFEPQVEIQTKNKKYIVDFYIESDSCINKFIKKDFKLIIECDGYNFHQKTKKQVDYDNQREYDLKMEKYEILRFSGSKIYNEPIKCAEEILEYIREKNE